MLEPSSEGGVVNQFEREEDALTEQLDRGEITPAEFNRQLRELQRDYRACAQEAAERAFQDELDRW
jgi:phage tail tape-measure protein